MIGFICYLVIPRAVIRRWSVWGREERGEKVLRQRVQRRDEMESGEKKRDREGRGGERRND